MQSGNRQISNNRLAGLKRFINFQQWGIIFIPILLIIVLSISSPVFLSARNIRNILQQISTLGILSMGMTILMISGGIDLSVGSSISVVAVIVGKLLKASAPVGFTIAVGLLVGSFIGLINGLLASHTRAHPFILTLGTMTLLQGVAIIITEGYPITDLGKKFEYIGDATIWNIPFTNNTEQVNRKFMIRKGNRSSQDYMDDEVVLCVTKPDRMIIITGCSHRLRFLENLFIFPGHSSKEFFNIISLIFAPVLRAIRSHFILNMK